jgi:hypothetical protein
MLRAIAAILAAGTLLAAPLAAQEPAPTLPVRRIVLYKHGVGYFARQGAVEGDARIPLRFKAREMSDLLKSMTVLDLGGGAITGIAYESTKTVDQQLGEYTFNLRAAGSLPAVLEQMKGSEVALRVGEREVVGRVLAVEKRIERKDNVQSEIYRLSILIDGGGVKSYDLPEIAEVRFTDPRLQAELHDYLRVLFSRHRRDQKEVVITAAGKGKRDIFVSYVQEQPVWKVSYRVVLEEKKPPLLQAWAIVDNVSEEDWDRVQISLVSGLPVSFVQDLYSPWYVKRPVIQAQRETSVGPVVYEAGEAADKDRLGVVAMMAAPAAPPMAKSALRERRAAAPAEADAAGFAAPPPEMLRNMAQQAAAAVAQTAGALFIYDVKEPVTLKRDRSALLPIACAPIDGARVAIYNETTRRDNPMEAVRLRNTTGLTLEGGPVTVIEEDTYAGEALVDTFKADEQRYISFAVDLGTRVNARLGSTQQTIVRVTIANGLLTTHYKQQETKTYALVNVEPKEKTIVVEHPLRPNWKLIEPAKPIETTPQNYRFEVKLPAKGKAEGKAELKVVEELPGESTYAVTSLSRDQILLWVRQKYLDEKTQKFLERVAELQGQVAELNRQAAEQEQQRNEAMSAQRRLPDMLRALGQSEQERATRERLVKQINAYEDAIQKTADRQAQLKTERETKEKELRDLIAAFSFERKI